MRNTSARRCFCWCRKQDFVRTRKGSNGSGLDRDLKAVLASLATEDTNAMRDLINQFEPETLRAKLIPNQNTMSASSVPRKDCTIATPSPRLPLG